jgi:hypothetical protein
VELGGCMQLTFFGLSNFADQGYIDQAWNNFGEDFIHNMGFQLFTMGIAKGLRGAAGISSVTKNGLQRGFALRALSYVGKKGSKFMDFAKPYVSPFEKSGSSGASVLRAGAGAAQRSALRNLTGTGANFIKKASVRFITEYTEEIIEEALPSFISDALLSAGVSPDVAEFVSELGELIIATINSGGGGDPNMTQAGLSSNKLRSKFGVRADADGNLRMSSFDQFQKGLNEHFGQDNENVSVFISPLSGNVSLYMVGMDGPLVFLNFDNKAIVGESSVEVKNDQTRSTREQNRSVDNSSIQTNDDANVIVDPSLFVEVESDGVVQTETESEVDVHTEKRVGLDGETNSQVEGSSEVDTQGKAEGVVSDNTAEGISKDDGQGVEQETRVQHAGGNVYGFSKTLSAETSGDYSAESEQSLNAPTEAGI